MPKYHFHAKDGRTYPDRDGTTLPNDDAARIEAAKVLGDFLREKPDELWADQSFRLTVTDHADLTLFVLEVTVTESPAAAAPRGPP